MINKSELIVNEDYTTFHLHLDGTMIADTILLVGDPKRAVMISEYFSQILYSAANREYISYTGLYKGSPVTVLSTGIGVGAIDIAINELHFAANIDLKSRKPNEKFRHLNIIRLGTCGGIHENQHIGTYVSSEYSIGLDSLAYFYNNTNSFRNIELEDKLVSALHWKPEMSRPYAVRNSETLLAKFDAIANRGLTLSAVGFYAPQGREVSLPVWDDNYIRNIENFSYNNLKIENFEMEGAPIALLGNMLGHDTATVCAVIAQRKAGESNTDYETIIRKLIEFTLDKVIK